MDLDDGGGWQPVGCLTPAARATLSSLQPIARADLQMLRQGRDFLLTDWHVKIPSLKLNLHVGHAATSSLLLERS